MSQARRKPKAKAEMRRAMRKTAQQARPNANNVRGRGTGPRRTKEVSLQKTSFSSSSCSESLSFLHSRTVTAAELSVLTFSLALSTAGSRTARQAAAVAAPCEVWCCATITTNAEHH